MIATLLLIALQEKGYTETLPKHLVEFKMAAIPGGEVKIGDKKVLILSEKDILAVVQS